MSIGLNIYITNMINLKSVLSINKGITRVVILMGGIVIKFPRIGVGQINFLTGCLANLKERQKTRWGIYKDLITPTLWCLWGGLMAIQKRITVKEEPLPKDVLGKFRSLTADSKPTNFGYTKDGRLVCCDYGD